MNLALAAQSVNAKPPVRVAIIGLVHDHANGFIPSLNGQKDVELVGIVEPDKKLAARDAERFHLDKSLFFTSLKDLLAHTNAQAAALFTSAYDHKEAVEECAERGLDVMMEKPFAVNMDHALAMKKAAAKYGINLIVNYETTWYPGNAAVADMARRGELGDLRKIVVHDGHRGPKEIGCSETFLSWLTDPKLNGGGALIDFGCYGADLATLLMNGARPVSVTAVTQHIKPEIYPKVEDEATIVVAYPKAQAIIQASWNWPFDRKDMEVYGAIGYALVPNRNLLRVRLAGQKETEQIPAPLAAPMTDPASYLAAVVRKEITPAGLSSMQVNLVVTEILDAARKSAATGRRIDLPEKAPYESN
ncbi:MAG TPA: Gfo/Idh/MocA family oxidoreductase [Verrucomicrobiae bacterium]|nr:Gfo/Idh/MocA family oxidoreductase [Verrucomicrobiae bacterium]